MIEIAEKTVEMLRGEMSGLVLEDGIDLSDFRDLNLVSAVSVGAYFGTKLTDRWWNEKGIGVLKRIAFGLLSIGFIVLGADQVSENPTVDLSLIGLGFGYSVGSGLEVINKKFFEKKVMID